jgi:hypothetical protein
LDQSGSQQLQFLLSQEQSSYQGLLSAGGCGSMGPAQVQPQVQLQQQVPLKPQMQQLLTAVTADQVQEAPGLSGFYDPNLPSYTVQQPMQVLAQQQQQLLPVLQQQAQTQQQQQQQQQVLLQQVQQPDATAFSTPRGSGVIPAGGVTFTGQTFTGHNAALLQQLQMLQQQTQQQQQQQVYVSSGGLTNVVGAASGSLGLFGTPGLAAAAHGLGIPSLQQDRQGIVGDYVGIPGGVGIGAGVQQPGVQYLQLAGGGLEYLTVSGPASAGASLGMFAGFNSLSAQGIDLRTQQQQQQQQQQQVFYTLPQGY